MDGFLKFKRLNVMLCAAEYHRVGFQYCRWPLAPGPKIYFCLFGHRVQGNLHYWKPSLWYSAAHSMINSHLGTTFMVTIVNLVPSHNSAVHGFLIFKRLHVMLWAAEYHRLGFPYCRWPWALGPKIHMHKTPDFFSQLFMDSVQFFMLIAVI